MLISLKECYKVYFGWQKMYAFYKLHDNFNQLLIQYNYDNVYNQQNYTQLSFSLSSLYIDLKTILISSL